RPAARDRLRERTHPVGRREPDPAQEHRGRRPALGRLREARAGARARDLRGAVPAARREADPPRDLPGLPARAGARGAGRARRTQDARQGGAAPVSEPLWRPSPGRAAAAQINAFRTWCEPLAGRPLADTRALHAWSIAD